MSAIQETRDIKLSKFDSERNFFFNQPDAIGFDASLQFMSFEDNVREEKRQIFRIIEVVE
jgi:hypothetical protein